ncbi:MAG: hypothetical protein HY741_00340 [Chloroflexi bacterium]|nr:hypothetical protein [Chloroflexota bacterium]
MDTSDKVELPSPAEGLALIQKLETLRKSRVITLFAYPNVFMRNDIPMQIYLQLRQIGRTERIDLFLNSTGGLTEVPWRIITLIRNFCEHFGVLIPYTAHSAATHLAMGADEIVMGDMSELSPVDPSQAHALGPKDGEKVILVSVQEVRHLFQLITQEGKYSPESLGTIYSALFDKVHPLTLGAIERSYELARLISKNALSTHLDSEKDAERIEKLVDAFSGKFYSHRYPIGWKEAKEAGLDVTYVKDELWETMWELFNFYNAFAPVGRPISQRPVRVAKPIVWIDSAQERRILQEVYEMQLDKKTGIAEGEPLDAKWLGTPWNETTEEEAYTEMVATTEEN